MNLQATGLPARRRFAGRGALVMFLITVAVFSFCLRNDFVAWDDLNMIVHNPLFNPPTWAGTAWYWTHPAWNLYQPMTTTLWSLCAWAGWVNSPDHFGGHMNPAVFHLASILLHATAAVFVFKILRLATKNDLPAALGSLLFAVHPIQVESVACAGLGNVPLSGCLSMLAIYQYLLATDPAAPTAHRRKTFHWTVASIALVLAMLARPSAIVVGPIAMILDLAIHQRPLRAIFPGLIPWAVLIFCCVFWTASIQHGVDAAQLPAWFRPMIASDAMVFYLQKILLPLHLGMDYGRSPQTVRHLSSCWFMPIIPIAAGLIAITTWRRHRLLAAGVLIFFIAMLPNSGLIPFDWQLVSTVSDRYAYLGMMGIAIIAAAILQEWPIAKYAAMGIVAILIALTQVQINTWRDGESLFRHAIAVNPNSWYARGNLAVVIADQSPDEAIWLCRQSINLRSDRADVWNTLGSLLMSRKDQPQAISQAIVAFATAHRLAPAEPIFAQNLAHAQQESASEAKNNAVPGSP